MVLQQFPLTGLYPQKYIVMENILKLFFSFCTVLIPGKHLFSEPGHQFQQQSIFFTIALFKLLSDHGSQSRALAPGGDSQGQVTLADNSRYLESAGSRGIDHIDQLTDSAGIPDNRILYCVVIRGSKDQQGIVKVSWFIAPVQPLKTVCCCLDGKGFCQIRADNPYPGTLCQQTSNLTFRNPASPNNNAEFVFDFEADRIHGSRVKG